jgi:hypothetical protein
MLSMNIDKTALGMAFDMTFKVGQHIRLRPMLAWGRLRGEDAASANVNDTEGLYRYARNLQFRNDIIELSGQFIYDLVGGMGRFYRRPSTTPYLFTGIGVIYSNPKARMPEDLGDSWVSLRPLQTEGKAYSPISICIPLGGGVRFKVDDRIDVGVEASLRFTFTDYLDDVSSSYVNPASLSSDLARRMANRTGELTSRSSGREREMDKVTAVLGPVVTLNGVPTLSGMGMEGDKRGTPNKDAYISLNVHASYVIGIKSYRPHPKR